LAERKDTPIPYISHLLTVTSLVIEHGEDDDEDIAAHSMTLRIKGVQRKEAYLARLRGAFPSVLLVSAADKWEVSAPS
jgi:hypothetical protein